MFNSKYNVHTYMEKCTFRVIRQIQLPMGALQNENKILQTKINFNCYSLNVVSSLVASGRLHFRIC